MDPRRCPDPRATDEDGETSDEIRRRVHARTQR
jgi:hypothetical protein